jgi:Ca2+-transporting ATPase
VARLPLAEVLMVAISQMVSMVPEGLPVAMTIALAVGMQRMADRGAIIRRLSAVETLGSTTVICSDKTGTLTRNEMTAVALWLPGGREIAVGGIGYAPEGELHEGGRRCGRTRPTRRCANLLQAAALCNDAELLPPEDERAGWTVLGDPTEGALLVLAARPASTSTRCAAHAPREAELPFDADTKLMATATAWPTRRAACGSRARPRPCCACARAHGRSGLQAARAAEAMATQALRVLAFATRGRRRAGSGGRLRRPGRPRALLGLVGQIDPPREEVKRRGGRMPPPASARSWSPATTSSPAWRSRANSASRATATAPSTAPSSNAWARPNCATQLPASPSSRACSRRRSCAS